MLLHRHYVNGQTKFMLLHRHVLPHRHMLLHKKLKLYFISITQKAHGTYICVLDGADVGVMRSKVVEETGEPGENL